MARRRSAIVALILVALLVVVGGRRAAMLLPEFASWVESQGAWAPVFFALGYVFAALAFVPGSLLTLAAGTLFGLGKGTALVFASATLGASLAFLVARYVARGAIERRLASFPRFSAIDRALERDGLRTVLLLRLSPLVPFNVLNYALGLTGVHFRDFLVGSIGMLPGTFFYVYLGRGIGGLARFASGATIETGGAGRLLFASGLVATAAATLLVTRVARRALEHATGAELDSAERRDERLEGDDE